jgi:hypothetical protein
VEEAPVGALGNDLLRRALDQADLVQAEGVEGPNPTSALSGAISMAGPVQMKENRSFSFMVEHHSSMQKLQRVSSGATGTPEDESYGRRSLSILRL